MNPIEIKKEYARLTDQEKTAMRCNLYAYMQIHPLQARQGVFGFLVRHAAVTLLVVLGIGAVSITSIAAKNTVPGDTLYPVKIQINERIQGAMRFSEEDKINWELEKMSRRINEEDVLADEDLQN